jgi:hypothetical protein
MSEEKFYRLANKIGPTLPVTEREGWTHAKFNEEFYKLGLSFPNKQAFAESMKNAQKDLRCRRVRHKTKRQAGDQKNLAGRRAFARSKAICRPSGRANQDKDNKVLSRPINLVSAAGKGYFFKSLK